MFLIKHMQGYADTYSVGLDLPTDVTSCSLIPVSSTRSANADKKGLVLKYFKQTKIKTL